LCGLLLTEPSPPAAPDLLALPPVPVVDIGRATAEQLMQLPGIGPKRAEEIVRYRSGKGFRRVSDLMKIRGIGLRTFDRLKPHITLGTQMPTAPQ
jgi:competence protein ComEA